MLRLKKVAVTGGLSCGKTTVCQLLKSFGAFVISADDIVHRLLSPNTQLGKQIIGLVGSDVLTSSKEFDRKKIADKVFQDSKLLSEFESLLHPHVIREIQREYERQKNLGCTLFVVEVPLLYETGFQSFFDTVVVVAADEGLCRQRYEQRDRQSGSYQGRLSRQWDIAYKRKHADIVIENNQDLSALEKQARQIFTHLNTTNMDI